ncbi:MAG: FtsH protease activity modulator HflK [Proteobacteria bacterium]|nr:FtsH protease activity modulator HflK [Pseudomonadota bacterium]
MNWDWEKLQQRRQRPPGGPGGPNLGDLNVNFDKFKNMGFPGWKILIGVLVLLWLASGIYIVGPDEVGVVKRFGAFDSQTEPGPHYHWPAPFESVLKPQVTKVHRVEVGFQSLGRSEFTQQSRLTPEESLMLTGDENIVDVQYIVQYKINDPAKYLFNLKGQEATVKSVAEAAMREVVGYNKIDAVLTTGKLEIQNECRVQLQSILDKYECGINVLAVQLQNVHPPKEVVDAFKDVASAREDKSRFINEADAYRNDLMPKARGQAAVLINQAGAYKETRIRVAKGEADKFLSVMREYNKAKDVTRKRLYLETMEKILSNPELDKIIISDDVAGSVLPYLSLDRVQGTTKGGTQ